MERSARSLQFFTTALILGVLLQGCTYLERQDVSDLEAPETNPLGEPIEEATAVDIEMPFYAQAPHGNWDYPWQEACEEASVLLAANVYKNFNLNVDQFNEELLHLVNWEIDYFGAYEHTTIEQTAEMMELQYGLETVIYENPTFENIQGILNKSHLIIAPFAGKYLYNPNYKNGGPVYHMMVIKGYNAEKRQIVTHDVGTRHGANYVYTWDVIDFALHDYAPNILEGTPRLIEIFPPTAE